MRTRVAPPGSGSTRPHAVQVASDASSAACRDARRERDRAAAERRRRAPCRRRARRGRSPSPRRSRRARRGRRPRRRARPRWSLVAARASPPTGRASRRCRRSAGRAGSCRAGASRVDLRAAGRRRQRPPVDPRRPAAARRSRVRRAAPHHRRDVERGPEVVLELDRGGGRLGRVHQERVADHRHARLGRLLRGGVGVREEPRVEARVLRRRPAVVSASLQSVHLGGASAGFRRSTRSRRACPRRARRTRPSAGTPPCPPAGR